jgi:hypothetical protein
VQSQAQAPTMGRVILPMNAAYRNPKAKSIDNSWLSKVTTTLRPIDPSAHFSVCQYPYSASNVDEAHLRRHGTTTFTWYTTLAKNTYGQGSDNEWSALPPRRYEWAIALTEKTPYDWSTLRMWRFPSIEALYCPVWNAFIVTDRHNSADRLRRLRWRQRLWRPWRKRIMGNQGGNRQIKHQRSFNTQQAKNYSRRRL